MLKSFLLIFFTFIGFANLSQAETLYIFGGAGFSHYEINEKDKTEINSKLTSLGFGSAETTTDAENLSYKFGAGIKIPLLFSIEGSYENLGSIDFKSTTTSPSETISAKAEIRGISIDLLKNVGPLAVSAGVMSLSDNIEISTSKGNIDLPIDKIVLPKLGAKFRLKNYRIEYTRVFITPSSHLNSIIVSYVLDIF